MIFDDPERIATFDRTVLAGISGEDDSDPKTRQPGYVIHIHETTTVLSVRLGSISN
jgi:hypothetical protein